MIRKCGLLVRDNISESLSAAVIDQDAKPKDAAVLCIQVDGMQTADPLAHLSSSIPQSSLETFFLGSHTKQIIFTVKGTAPIHVIGYLSVVDENTASSETASSSSASTAESADTAQKEEEEEEGKEVKKGKEPKKGKEEKEGKEEEKESKHIVKKTKQQETATKKKDDTHKFSSIIEQIQATPSEDTIPTDDDLFQKKTRKNKDSKNEEDEEEEEEIIDDMMFANFDEEQDDADDDDDDNEGKEQVMTKDLAAKSKKQIGAKPQEKKRKATNTDNSGKQDPNKRQKDASAAAVPAKNIRCSECGRMFEKMMFLRQHQKNKHQAPQDKSKAASSPVA